MMRNPSKLQCLESALVTSAILGNNLQLRGDSNLWEVQSTAYHLQLRSLSITWKWYSNYNSLHEWTKLKASLNLQDPKCKGWKLQATYR